MSFNLGAQHAGHTDPEQNKVVDRWCSYCCHIVTSNKGEFIRHIHDCEAQFLDQKLGKKK